MSSALVKTIQDMERLHYSNLGAQYIQKDAPVLSTTTGVYNAVYGAQVWAQLNEEANMFSALPKYPWQRSGWRVITARAGSTADGGVAENGNLPATIKPTFAELSTKPGIVAHNFDVSESQQFLAQDSADDAFGAMEQMRPIMAVKHREAINQQLLVDADTAYASGFQSIDRVCSSKDEEDTLLTADDADIYGIDRSAATTYDAYVSHASGTDRSITDTLMRTMLQNLEVSGAHTTVIVTHPDTYYNVLGLYDTYVRYTRVGEQSVQVGVNGVQTAVGTPVGIKIPTLYGIPVITSKDVPKDTTGRMYFLDTTDAEGHGTPRLGMQMAKLTEYFEAGMNTGNPFSIDRLGTEGMFRTMGEVICRNFIVQGKLRDLKG